jgi:Immunity protein 63
MKVTLDDIKILIDNLVLKINAPQNLLPTYGQSIDGAHPHIEVDKNGQLYYVIVERGEELKRDFAADTNDLLYRVFNGVTFSMAVDFELNNRIVKEDCRRQIFSKQEELLATLDKGWGIRLEKEHQWILRTHPFDDLASIRANYSKQLTDKGTESWIAWNEACKKYPLPKSS